MGSVNTAFETSLETADGNSPLSRDYEISRTNRATLFDDTRLRRRNVRV